MRVDTGIILSVLSFSVFAAVIPNHDYYVPLLVRRAVSPENGAVLWKRNGDDQMNSDGSGSGANGGGRSSNGLGRLSPSSSSAGGFQLPIPMAIKGQNADRTMSRDSKTLGKVVVKLSEVVQGGQSRYVIPEIRMLLGTSLMSTKLLNDLYDDKERTPLASSHKQAADYKSVTKELNRMKNTAKELVKTYLDKVYRVIANIIKHPRNVMSELDKIISRSTAMFKLLISLCEKTI
ncbi:hypothetical protein BASA83_010897 [Batrachochytrium salamandrivorans]|nr:hypothetical protein BASA83_010897 [Batrachochytrium salamandrivorans]